MPAPRPSAGMSCKNSAHVLPPSVTRIQRGLPIGTDIGAEGRTWRRYGPGRRQTADGHRRRIAPEPRSHLSSPGLTINAAINERPNEHGKCMAPGHLSATGSTESADSPSNSTSCELCSRCRAARSCSSHRGAPCHDFLDLRPARASSIPAMPERNARLQHARLHPHTRFLDVHAPRQLRGQKEHRRWHLWWTRHHFHTGYAKNSQYSANRPRMSTGGHMGT